MGGVPGVKKGALEEIEIGSVVGGVSRGGKWERRGVCGGGIMRENSDARDERIVCVGERVKMMLTFAARRETSDCGDMSSAYAGCKSQRSIGSKRHRWTYILLLARKERRARIEEHLRRERQDSSPLAL